MKRTSLLGISVLMMFAGCARGWCPLFNRGAHCVSSSCLTAPLGQTPPSGVAMTGGECFGCETVGSSYGEYPAEGYIHSTLPGYTGPIQESVNGRPVP